MWLAAGVSRVAMATGVDPAADVLVCTSRHDSRSVVFAPDGLGGTLVAWVDQADDTLGDVHVQRLDARGVLRWRANGVPACAATGAQSAPVVAHDGAGGAFVAWQDVRDAQLRVYVQHVDESGRVAFAADGDRLSGADASAFAPAIVPDDSGGAVVAWGALRGGRFGMFAERLAADGTRSWSANGLPIDTALAGAEVPRLVRAGNGTTLLVSMPFSGGGWRMQKLDAQGAMRWPQGGVTPFPDPPPASLELTDDAAGGALLAGEDRTLPGETRIVAQRVSANGTLPWGASGVVVFSAAEAQLAPSIAAGPDGSAGIAWLNTAFVNPRIFAQRLDADGRPLWGAAVRVATIGRDQGRPSVSAGRDGDWFVAWPMVLASRPENVFAQRLDASGAKRWDPDGAPVTHVLRVQGRAAIRPAPHGGATILLEDAGAGAIVARALDAYGFPGLAPARVGSGGLFLWSAAPVPAAHDVTIRFALRGPRATDVDILDVAGRQVRSLVRGESSPGQHTVVWDGTTDAGARAPSGAYLVRCHDGVDDLVGRIVLVR